MSDLTTHQSNAVKVKGFPILFCIIKKIHFILLVVVSAFKATAEKQGSENEN